MRNLLVLLSLVAAAAFVPVELRAQDFTITIKNHRFTPSELKVPANKRIQLTVVNDDPTPEEFESHELNREKIVTGNARITVFIGPLKPGRYPYFGDFNQATAQGVLIAQ